MLHPISQKDPELGTVYVCLYVCIHVHILVVTLTRTSWEKYTSCCALHPIFQKDPELGTVYIYIYIYMSIYIYRCGCICTHSSYYTDKNQLRKGKVYSCGLPMMCMHVINLMKYSSGLLPLLLRLLPHRNRRPLTSIGVDGHTLLDLTPQFDSSFDPTWFWVEKKAHVIWGNVNRCEVMWTSLPYKPPSRKVTSMSGQK